MTSIRPYLLAETNWKHLQNETFDLAVLPWGATEAHNYHLPYATDIFESDYIAAESAKIAWEKGAKVIVLPTIPFGVNTGQKDIYLDINLNPTTQLAILNDVTTVLNRQGIKKLLILNSHGGNNFKPLVRELGLKFPEMFICFSNWFQSVDKSHFFTNNGEHADEMETSLMLHLKPGLVLGKESWGSGDAKKNKIKAFNEGWAWAERRWSEITIDTGVGNPIEANKEKGAQYFAAITKKMGTFIYELAVADINNLYE
ncbi:MAG: creatininase family protein [Bacteroidales bacterium]|nr:creatininase family protein [Bacteroidales bacterium]